MKFGDGFCLLQVKWIEQQYAKKRVKRDVLYNDPKWNVMWYLVGAHLWAILIYDACLIVPFQCYFPISCFIVIIVLHYI